MQNCHPFPLKVFKKNTPPSEKIIQPAWLFFFSRANCLGNKWSFCSELKWESDPPITESELIVSLSPGVNTPQDTNYTATCLLSQKLYKLDEPDMRDTAREATTNSSVIYSYGPPHMANQK